MLNEQKVGTSYPPVRYEVAREKIREYAEATGATGETGSRYRARDGDVVAPPTFAACFALTGDGSWMRDPELGVHPRFVHGGQEFVFHRAVRVGDVLECTPTIERIDARGGNEVMVVAVHACDEQTKDPVVTGRATLVFLGAGDDGGDD